MPKLTCYTCGKKARYHLFNLDGTLVFYPLCDEHAKEVEEKLIANEEKLGGIRDDKL